MTKILLFLLFGSMLIACSSGNKKSDETRDEAGVITPSKPSPVQKVEEIIDLRALQTVLKLDPKPEALGYQEKPFNTCQVGSGYSSSNNCRSRLLVVINFQLMCRDSEGTISEIVRAANLEPLSNQDIKWTLKNANDKVRTSSDGYGQIVMVSSESQKNQRLRLANTNDFLAIRAREVRSLIVPQNWCR